MGDPRETVPYHDPYDDHLDYEYLKYMSENPNPTLAGTLPSYSNICQQQQQQQQQQPPSSFSTATQPHPSGENVDVADPNDPFTDPMIWEIFVEKNRGDSSNQAGPSTVVGGKDHGVSIGEAREENWGLGNLDGGRPLPAWPPQPVPFGCTCCHVLREIIHTDGNYTTKLEVHGRLGIICHAVLQNWNHGQAGPSNPQHYMFDFCKKSIGAVKQYLHQYCVDRKNAGFILVQDPLAVFYKALTVGLDWDDNADSNNEFYDPSPTNSGEEHVAEGENDAERMPRSNLSLQRERAGKLTLKDFVDYFHLPIEKAARRMNLCPTVVKKICRRDGMNRWPHRKIKSLQRQISTLEVLLNSNDANERANVQAEIERLRQEISNICRGGR